MVLVYIALIIFAYLGLKQYLKYRERMKSIEANREFFQLQLGNPKKVVADDALEEAFDEVRREFSK